MHDDTKAGVQARLNRIAGQISGLQRMVAGDRYCIDVLTQIAAVRAALHKVEEQILLDHVEHCVADAFASGGGRGTAAQGGGAGLDGRPHDALVSRFRKEHAWFK